MPRRRSVLSINDSLLLPTRIWRTADSSLCRMVKFLVPWMENWAIARCRRIQSRGNSLWKRDHITTEPTKQSSRSIPAERNSARNSIARLTQYDRTTRGCYTCMGGDRLAGCRRPLHGGSPILSPPEEQDRLVWGSCLTKWIHWLVSSSAWACSVIYCTNNIQAPVGVQVPLQSAVQCVIPCMTHRLSL
jgi:hypothetical protein